MVVLEVSFNKNRILFYRDEDNVEDIFTKQYDGNPINEIKKYSDCTSIIIKAFSPLILPDNLFVGMTNIKSIWLVGVKCNLPVLLHTIKDQLVNINLVNIRTIENKKYVLNGSTFNDYSKLNTIKIDSMNISNIGTISSTSIEHIELSRCNKVTKILDFRSISSLKILEIIDTNITKDPLINNSVNITISTQ